MTEAGRHRRVTVRVRDLPLLADIGINPDEVGRRQPLIVSVELRLDEVPGETIGDTVDYRRVSGAAEALALVHVPLIESFALRLAEEFVAWPRVRSASVFVDKPFALARGQAGVKVVVEND